MVWDMFLLGLIVTAGPAVILGLITHWVIYEYFKLKN